MNDRRPLLLLWPMYGSVGIVMALPEILREIVMTKSTG